LGAVDFAWVVAETHRREAVAVLRQLAKQSGRRQVRKLGELIPPLQSQPRANPTTP
jgi:hypothetical protein